MNCFKIILAASILSLHSFGDVCNDFYAGSTEASKIESIIEDKIVDIERIFAPQLAQAENHVQQAFKDKWKNRLKSLIFPRDKSNVAPAKPEEITYQVEQATLAYLKELLETTQNEKDLRLIEERIRKDFPHSTLVQESSFGREIVRLAEELINFRNEFKAPQKFTADINEGVEVSIIDPTLTARMLREKLINIEQIQAIRNQISELSIAHTKYATLASKPNKSKFDEALMQEIFAPISRSSRSWENIPKTEQNRLLDNSIKSGLLVSESHMLALQLAFRKVLEGNGNKLEAILATTQKEKAEEAFDAMVELSKTKAGAEMPAKKLAEIFLNDPNVKSIRDKVADATLNELKTAWEMYRAKKMAVATESNARQGYSAAQTKVSRADFVPSDSLPTHLLFSVFEKLSAAQYAIIKNLLSSRTRNGVTLEQRHSFLKEMIDDSVTSMLVSGIFSSRYKETSSANQVKTKNNAARLTATIMLVSGMGYALGMTNHLIPQGDILNMTNILLPALAVAAPFAAWKWTPYQNDGSSKLFDSPSMKVVIAIQKVYYDMYRSAVDLVFTKYKKTGNFEIDSHLESTRNFLFESVHSRNRGRPETMEELSEIAFKNELKHKVDLKKALAAAPPLYNTIKANREAREVVNELMEDPLNQDRLSQLQAQHQRYTQELKILLPRLGNILNSLPHTENAEYFQILRLMKGGSKKVKAYEGFMKAIAKERAEVEKLMLQINSMKQIIELKQI